MKERNFGQQCATAGKQISVSPSLIGRFGRLQPTQEAAAAHGHKSERLTHSAFQTICSSLSLSQSTSLALPGLSACPRLIKQNSLSSCQPYYFCKELIGLALRHSEWRAHVCCVCACTRERRHAEMCLCLFLSIGSNGMWGYGKLT